uniref:RING-CH-type domain-containing protein n=1 Tax=viral metagenome TaxID=1070528 RepID=A0A6C0CL44_9ZZZZ
MTNKTCRICFESYSEGVIISPCKCDGSIKYIHRKCALSEGEICTVCKTPYTEDNLKYIIDHSNIHIEVKYEICSKYMQKCRITSCLKMTENLEDDKSNCELLFKCIEKDNINVVRYYIENIGVNVNCFIKKSVIVSQPLQRSRSSLIQEHMDNSPTFYGESFNTPLSVAVDTFCKKPKRCWSNSITPVIKYLVENGAEITEDLINVCVKYDLLKLLKYFLKNGANIQPEQIIMSKNNISLDMIKFLLNIGVPICDVYDFTDFKTAKYLLKRGAKLNNVTNHKIIEWYMKHIVKT